MFLNILETLEHWFVGDSDNFGGHKDTSDVGGSHPPRTHHEYQVASGNLSYREVHEHTQWGTPETHLHPAHFNGLGNPGADATCWHQQHHQNSCAVVAQIDIYKSMTGQDISEDEACKIAQAHGWYDPETGTSPENVGKFLEYCGIHCEQHYNANLVDIADALERGEKVMVGLDANEIWHPLRDPDTGSPMKQSHAGHAVWVTGIEQEADGSVKIILNDSGTPDGRMETVDAKDFLNAWDDFGNFLVVEHPPQ